MSDLLKVLEMPEAEQWEWLTANQQKYRYTFDFVYKTKEWRDMVLADLAFRLRDEAVKNSRDNYLDAMCTVTEHCEGVCVCDKCHARTRKGKMMDWWADAHPIHWIIAALTAKEK